MTPRGADVDRYFYPRPPRGGRQLSTSDMAQGRRFLSTPSARRATVNSFNVYIDGVFLSTPSARRATTAAVGYDDDYEFLSTPSARRATCTSGRSYPDSAISIHALREEGDNCSSLAAAMTGRISIHALREEGDNFLLRTWHKADDFYPRPPRGGRPSTASTFTLTAYFYPRPPRGGRQLPQWVTTMIMNFYPRPPRGGRRPAQSP